MSRVLRSEVRMYLSDLADCKPSVPGYGDCVPILHFYFDRSMPFPYIAAAEFSHTLQPLSQEIDIPCLLLDLSAKGPGAVPPVIRQPFSEAICNSARYSLGTLGHVFTQVARCTFLHPLKVNAVGNFCPVDVNRNTHGSVPGVIMSFGGDGPLTLPSFTYEDAVSMEYWQSGLLVTLLLNLRNRNYLTAQALFLQRAGHDESVPFDNLSPFLMEYAELLPWQSGDGSRGEHTPRPARFVFEEMCRVAHHPSAVGRNPGVPLSCSGFEDHLKVSDEDIPF